jgi:hypothetical protein
VESGNRRTHGVYHKSWEQIQPQFALGTQSRWTFVVLQELWKNMASNSAQCVMGTGTATQCIMGSGNRLSCIAHHKLWSKWNHNVHHWFWQQIELHCTSGLIWPDEPRVCIVDNENRWGHGLHYGFWEHMGPQCVSWIMMINIATECLWILSTQGITLSSTSYGKRWSHFVHHELGEQCWPFCAPCMEGKMDYVGNYKLYNREDHFIACMISAPIENCACLSMILFL